jgi:hypothetical protein
LFIHCQVYPRHGVTRAGTTWTGKLTTADRPHTDREGVHGTDAATIKELQERTKRAAEETSKAGTSMRDGL